MNSTLAQLLRGVLPEGAPQGGSPAPIKSMVPLALQRLMTGMGITPGGSGDAGGMVSRQNAGIPNSSAGAPMSGSPGLPLPRIGSSATLANPNQTQQELDSVHQTMGSRDRYG